MSFYSRLRVGGGRYYTSFTARIFSSIGPKTRPGFSEPPRSRPLRSRRVRHNIIFAKIRTEERAKCPNATWTQRASTYRIAAAGGCRWERSGRRRPRKKLAFFFVFWIFFRRNVLSATFAGGGSTVVRSLRFAVRARTQNAIAHYLGRSTYGYRPRKDERNRAIATRFETQNKPKWNKTITTKR